MQTNPSIHPIQPPLSDHMFNEAVVGMAIVDSDGTILRANAKMAALFEYTIMEMIGRKLREFTHPEDASADEQSFAALISGKISDYSMVKRYRTGADRIVRLKLHVSRVPGSADQATVALGQISQPTLDFKDLEYFVERISALVAKAVAAEIHCPSSDSRGLIAIWRTHWPTWLPWILGTTGVLAAMIIRQIAATG